MPGSPVQIGPFSGGLNTYSDETSIADNQLVVCDNFELDLDGSLVSRPPIVDRHVTMPLGNTGNMTLLGYYTGPGNVPFLLGSDGLNSTYYFNGTNWTLITSTFAATAFAQFNGLAYMLAPIGSTNPGGSWSPTAGFTAEPNMPKGEAIVSYKFRLWIAQGKDAVSNATRLYFSNVLSSPSGFWPSTANFVDIGAGDGQAIVQIAVYYNALLIFRTASVYSYGFNSDPSSGVVSQVIQGVGLQDSNCLVAFESYLYFMYNDKAYEFINNRATQVNVTVPFEEGSHGTIYEPYSVNVFNKRIIFTFYSNTYVFNLNTRTWTTWTSTAWGPLGKFYERPGSASQAASAITYSSQAVPPVGVDFTNYIKNPEMRSSPGGYGSAAFDGSIALSYTTGISGLGNGVTTCATLTVNSNVSTWLQITSTSANSPTIIAGNEYTFVAAVRMDLAQSQLPGSRTVRAGIYWRDGFGNAISESFGTLVTLTDPGTGFAPWQWVTVTATAPAGAALATMETRLTNGMFTGGVFQTTCWMLVDGDGIDPNTGVQVVWFDGASTQAGFVFAWAGTAHNSNSTRTSGSRAQHTLFITDAVTTEKENMKCSMRTKNYSYEASSVYKRLFWWGMEAIFRGEVTAQVIPVTLNFGVTWGQLFSGSHTWGELLTHTWGHPLSGSIAVEDSESLAGFGAVRVFTKFPKSLRFRQIAYAVSFDTNGSTDNAPVRLFQLQTYVAAKETVVKKNS